MLILPEAAAGRGKLAENVMHFARILRGAGLRVGPDRVIDCMKAIEFAGTDRRDDFYWTMSAIFLSREEQRPIFDQAFQIFWRDPKLLEKMMQALLPKTYGKVGPDEQEQSQRLTDSLFNQPKREEPEDQPEQKVELDAKLTFSSREVLQRMDFDTMTAAELAEAKKMLSQLRLPLPEIRTRRYATDPHGARVSLRATLRASLREGGDIIPLVRTAPKTLHPPLVVLCDISGSMNPYARMFLHFLHAITNDRDRVSVFVFGTRLTNVTRQLKHPHRDLPARLQLALGAAGPRAERLPAAGHGRPGPRGGRRPFRGNGAPAHGLQAPDLDEPPAPLREVRGEAGGRACDASLRRPLPAGA